MFIAYELACATLENLAEHLVQPGGAPLLQRRKGRSVAVPHTHHSVRTCSCNVRALRTCTSLDSRRSLKVAASLCPSKACSHACSGAPYRAVHARQQHVTFR